MCQGLPAAPEARKRQGSVLSRTFRQKSVTLSTPWFWICSFQTVTKNFYCFKLPSLWYFVTAALGCYIVPLYLRKWTENSEWQNLHPGKDYWHFPRGTAKSRDHCLSSMASGIQADGLPRSALISFFPGILTRTHSTDNWGLSHKWNSAGHRSQYISFKLN